MVTYRPKKWFKLIFQLYKSDTFRILLPTIAVVFTFKFGFRAVSFVMIMFYAFAFLKKSMKKLKTLLESAPMTYL